MERNNQLTRGTKGERMRWIMGKQTIKEVLKASPRRLIKVCTHKKGDPLTEDLKAQGIPTLFFPKNRLSSIVLSESHQGFIGKVKEKRNVTPKEFLANSRQKSLVLMCDGIQDPQNFGAILRAGECFGVDGVIYSTNRNVLLTPAVSKASVGASEIVPLIPISNLATTVQQFQDSGYVAVATQVSNRSQLLYSFLFPPKTLLIIGGEGVGIQPLLAKKSDTHLYIPMKGQIDSLNVSQAVATFLSHWRNH